MTDFVKYHALGNDYLVLDPAEIDFPDRPAAIRVLCDRRFGIGADGLLLGPLRPVAADAPVEVALFNADGSSCGRSGNGLRIFARHLLERYGTGPDVVLRTAAGESRTSVRDPAAGVVRVEMGAPSYEPARVPVLDMAAPAVARPLLVEGRELAVTCLSDGNPHTVVPVAPHELNPEFARRWGPSIAGHARFPQRTNVEFVTVLDRATLRIEIFERAAGYALASGSGACAAACAAHALGLVDARVEVRMPGGDVEVVIGPGGAVSLTGVVEKVLTGWFAPALRSRLGRACASWTNPPPPEEDDG